MKESQVDLGSWGICIAMVHTAKSILIASTARRIEVEAYERFVLEDSERILLPWGFEMFTAKRLTVDHRDMYDIRPHLDITQVFSQCQSLEQAEM